ncbi:hypothetical protein FACS189443_6990 [Planctomycetales bacterium]|nr:hypothetical protein FACS189443_6990 [Planctomycetales bacterium]
MEERKPTYEELEALVKTLLLRIEKLEKMLFGKKSEKSKKNKAKEPQQTDSSNEKNEANPKRTREKNGGGGRNSFPPNIPRRDIPIPLHPDECRCPKCGKDYESMGEETTEVLHYVPMVLTVLRFIRERKKAACDCDIQKVKIAEMPIRNLDKGSVTTELIAAVLVNKYCDHLPVHRQVERLFKTSGVKPSESSVCRWRDVIAEQLAPLADLMKERIKMSCCINTDATTAPCRLPKEQNRLVNGNQYVYIGNEDEPYNVFDFQINQSAKGMLAFLDGYCGFVQCDAHGNYDALFQPKMVDLTKPPPLEVGCHAHCRRKFTEAEKYEPDDSKRILNLYKKLYKIEAEVKDCPFDERVFRRQEESVPLLNELFNACREIQSAELFLPKSPLGHIIVSNIAL